jgi:hypothetical protein
VAFSTPIFADDERQEVVGVLAMEAELGHFSDFRGSRDQFAVLIDFRPDQTGRAGLVVEHPFFARQLAEGRPVPEAYLDPETLARFEEVRQDRLRNYQSMSADVTDAAIQPDAPSNALSLAPYRDPIGGEFGGDWLASVEPVFVYHGSKGIDDIGWGVVVQERLAETLKPLASVRSMVRTGGFAALALVVVVIGALWGVVVLAVNAPLRLRTTRLGKSPITASSSAGSLSSRSVDESVNDRKSQASHGSKVVEGER